MVKEWRGLVKEKKLGRIAVDQDWVLAKLTEKWLWYYNTIFNDDLTVEEIKDWSVLEYVKPEAKDYMLNILNIHKFYRDLDVVKDSQRVLEKLSTNYEIFIVTDPFTRMSFKSKYDWLRENFPFIPVKNYVFTGNKSIVNADFLIDDGVHNLENFDGYGLLFEAPYNKDNEDFYIVRNWQDIEHIFFDYKLDEVYDFYQNRNGNKYINKIMTDIKEN